MISAWMPPTTFEERLRSACIPPRLALRWDLQQALWRGERELRLVPRMADPRYVKAVTTNPDLETVFLNMSASGIGITMKKR